MPNPRAGASLRLKGRNLTESEHIKLGAYHTIELEPGERPRGRRGGRQGGRGAGGGS